MKIGELAKLTDVSVETIRYYEKIGLLPPPARSANGYRHYLGAHQDRLLFIRRCRSLDMAQEEIRRLIELASNPMPTAAMWTPCWNTTCNMCEPGCRNWPTLSRPWYHCKSAAVRAAPCKSAVFWKDSRQMLFKARNQRKLTIMCPAPTVLMEVMARGIKDGIKN